MKLLLTAVAVGALSISATSLRADLLGSQVSGTLTFGTSTVNYFNPNYGFVPAQFGNSLSASNVTVDSGVEFGYNDHVNRDTADFTATGLTVRDACLIHSDCAGNLPFTMTFTDPAFATLTLLTNSLGVSYSLVGDVLTIHESATTVPGGEATATFSIGTAAVTPEPGTIGLVATGLLGVAGTIRRRFLA